jgi:hypothetical protein
MSRYTTLRLIFCALATSPLVAPLVAQTTPATSAAATGYNALPQASSAVANPLTQPTLSPGVLLLMELEGRFEKAVEVGGGKVCRRRGHAQQRQACGGWPRRHCGPGPMGSKNVPAYMAAAGCTDGAFERHGLYLGALRGPLPRQKRGACGDLRPLLYCMEKVTRWNLEGGPGCQRGRTPRSGGVLRSAKAVTH